MDFNAESQINSFIHRQLKLIKVQEIRLALRWIQFSSNVAGILFHVRIGVFYAEPIYSNCLFGILASTTVCAVDYRQLLRSF